MFSSLLPRSVNGIAPIFPYLPNFSLAIAPFVEDRLTPEDLNNKKSPYRCRQDQQESMAMGHPTNI